MDSFFNRFSHCWQLVLYGIPNQLIINAVVSVPQDVTHTAKAFPVGPRGNNFCVLTKPDSSLSNDLHLSFDCELRP